MVFNSAFFNANEQKFSLKAFEKKEIVIPINEEKSKVLVAGKYILSAETVIGNVKKAFEAQINFVEKSGIATKEVSEGFLIKKKTVEKTNEGNLPGVAEIVINKDIISRLFTTFSQIPDKSERSGFNVKYTWVSELKPAEKFTVQVSTNYAYPFLILLALIIGLFLIYTFTSSNLVLKKRVSFVRAKGGEFALKVTIAASTRKFVEKIAIVDKLPAMVKIYERFGANPPNKVDERNGRLEWDIERLQPGEERVFSYIIYSKVGIVGRFELPEATAVYERDGKIHETKSNKTYFSNEPLKKSED